MRIRPFIIAAAAVAVTWRVADGARAPACSYFFMYPPAIGRHTFMIATATATTVVARTDSTFDSRERSVPAQVMAVDDVAGYQSETIRRGLRSSDGRAVFVRYEISASCYPVAAIHGAVDSAGVAGLYVGLPRSADRWVDSMPTFDIVQARHYPLPQRSAGPSGHLIIQRLDSTPVMSASELFTMYRALWAESVTAHDTSVEPRIKRWLRSHPAAARKQPADQVTSVMLMAMTDAFTALHTIPFGGTFMVTVIAPGVDSLVMYARTTSRTRDWINDAVRDSLTGVPVALINRSFAIDLTTAPSLDGFEPASFQINPCPPIAVVVSALPIVPDADSSWTGETYPAAFLGCVPAGSALAALTQPNVMRTFSDKPATMTFRRHPDGRVTFTATAMRGTSPGLVIRGERVSTATYGAHYDEEND